MCIQVKTNVCTSNQCAHSLKGKVWLRVYLKIEITAAGDCSPTLPSLSGPTRCFIFNYTVLHFRNSMTWLIQNSQTSWRLSRIMLFFNTFEHSSVKLLVTCWNNTHFCNFVLAYKNNNKYTSLNCSVVQLFDIKKNIDCHQTHLLTHSLVSEHFWDSPLWNKMHLHSSALFCQLMGDDVSMDIYMMLYILHCTGVTFCLENRGSNVT